MDKSDLILLKDTISNDDFELELERMDFLLKESESLLSDECFKELLQETSYVYFFIDIFTFVHKGPQHWIYILQNLSMIHPHRPLLANLFHSLFAHPLDFRGLIQRL